MKRLDKVITSFGFNIVEDINNKHSLFVNDSAVNFDVRSNRECDVFVISGYGQYIKVGRVVTHVQRGADRKMIPHLNVIVDRPHLINREYWWQQG